VIGVNIIVYWGYSFLKGRDLLTQLRDTIAEYETVEGLTTSAP
jgi:hypothetical protein